MRKISFGQGVERIFPVHSKVVDKVDWCARPKSAARKLYYLRGLRGKAARLRDVEKVVASFRRWRYGTYCVRNLVC